MNEEKAYESLQVEVIFFEAGDVITNHSLPMEGE